MKKLSRIRELELGEVENEKLLNEHRDSVLQGVKFLEISSQQYVYT